MREVLVFTRMASVTASADHLAESQEGHGAVFDAISARRRSRPGGRSRIT
jgi:hypothetical protein